MIAGPNGAGKTSAAPDLLRDTVGIDAFVNADVIADGLAAFRPEAAAVQAGRIMLRRIREQVRQRVAAGGHDVPEGVVRRRFNKSIVNLGRIYMPLATAWRIYDGSMPGERPLIAHGSLDSAPTIVNSQRWAEVRTQIEEVP